MSATATTYRRPHLSAEGNMYPHARYASRAPTSPSTVQLRPPTPYACLTPASDSSSTSGEIQYTPPSSLDSPPTQPLESHNPVSSIDDNRRSSAFPIRCSDTKGACDVSGSLHGLPIRITTDEQVDFFVKYSKLKPEQYYAFHSESQDSDLRHRERWSHMLEAVGVDASILSKVKTTLHDFDRQFKAEPLELEDNPEGDSTYAGSEVDAVRRTALVRVRDKEALAHEGYGEDDEHNESYDERSYGARSRRVNSPAYRHPESRWGRPDIDDSDFEYINPHEGPYRI